MSTNRLLSMLGLGRDRTREEIIDHVRRRASDTMHYILADVTPENRDSIVPRVDVVLREREFGPEAARLYEDVRAGRADDLMEALTSKTLDFRNAYPVAGDAPGQVTIRVVYGLLPESRPEGPAV